MKRIRISCLLINVWYSLCYMHLQAKQYALVVAPIVDIGEKTTLTLPDGSTVTDIPISGGRLNQFVSCKRAHQLLYNEVVEIIGSNTKKKKLHIKVPQIFFATGITGHKENSFWVDTTGLIPFKELKKNKIDLSVIPDPISFDKKNIINDSTIATLQMPFTDPDTKITYSAGTRFKKIAEQNDTDSIAVFILNPELMKIKVTKVPTHLIAKTEDDRS